MSRNLSVQSYFRQTGLQHRPRLGFAGHTMPWKTWREQLVTELAASLGKMPEPLAPQPQILAEWNADGLIKQRVILDVEQGLSAVALIFRPANLTGRLPAIFCCHGHGAYGKDAVMGDRSSAERAANITAHHYDYGLQMAQAGFVTVAIDFRGFGERDDRRKPHYQDITHGRDLCNLHGLRATLLGRTVLGMNLHDARQTLDYLCTLDFVDPDRIGVMGLSLGGTMSVWMALTDTRIKAADVICYSDRFADFGMRDVNLCGSQITPGLFDLCDVPDLQGLIAPRPLLVEIGTQDECFLIDSAMSCHREVEKIYAAAGASDKLELDLFEGGHRWGGNKSVSFFERHLTAKPQ